jgi:DNA repair photolyase
MIQKHGPMPQLNPDGISVRGCTMIYAPDGRAEEYSPLAVNPYIGCGNGCVYCYVPDLIHIPREEFDAGAVPKRDLLEKLEKEARKYQALRITEQVMLSFTTDPYHPGDTSLTREMIKILQRYGLGVCTLTKGGRRALRDLDLFRPGRDAFAATLTLLDDAMSLKWERNAALPLDRIETLRAFHDAGIFTWASMEPVIDPAATLEIIRRTHRFVDLYKVGKMNHISLAKPPNWRQFTHDVVKVLTEVGARHYIKRDLQPYLPPGYDNPMRVKQFRETGEPELFPILMSDSNTLLTGLESERSSQPEQLDLFS